MVLANNKISLKLSGWKAITGRFPMTDTHEMSDTYKRRTGVVGGISGRRGFLNIRLADEGVCIFPFFARRRPCFVPWSRIRKVSVGDFSLLLAVDYEQPFEFSLPTEVLPAIRAKLSQQVFHRAADPFAPVKAAIEDKETPRWMAWIAGRAMQSVEKEVEKKKHDDVV